jgi:hypothetical protein
MENFTLTGKSKNLNNIPMIVSGAAVIAAVVVFYYVYRKLMNRFIATQIMASSILVSDHRHFESQKNEIEIMILGACEFRDGIDAKYFKKKAFNFSVPMSGYTEYYYFLKRYIGEMPSLKTVILSVCDNSFCSYTNNAVCFPILFNKLIVFGELLSVNSFGMKAKLLWRKWLYSTDIGKLHYGRKFLAANMKRFISQKLIRGKQGSTVGEAREDKKGRCATPEGGVIGAKKHFSYPIFDGRALYYFEKILHLCRERNVPIFAVSMPRSKYFLKYSERYVTEDMLMKNIIKNPRYEKFIHRHIDYLAIYRDEDDYFQAEGAMLNKKGKDALSGKLAEELSGAFHP